MRVQHALAAAAALIGLLTAYLLLWPVPVQPVVWASLSPPGYQGVHAANTRLANLKLIDIGAEEGPEHIAIGPDGKLYAAVASGRILRMALDGTGREVFAQTGGRVLGFDFAPDGRLIAADALRGLLAINPDGKVAMLAEQVNGSPILYADAVVVSKAGKAYFSDASMRFSPKLHGGTFEASVLDILEQRATGRIIEQDLVSGHTRVLATGLAFANGVALSADETQLFVAETGKYRVWRMPVAASGLNAQQPGGGLTLLFDNLPGYPDNLMRGQGGRIWLGFAKPRNKVVDDMASKPWMRSLTLRLPRALWPIPPRYGHVIAFDESGKVLADLQDPSGTYPETTGVTETPQRLYIHSLHAQQLGWMVNSVR